ncbi:hypothetical protein EQG64_20050 [Streptomyces sp. S6]|nr:hypothetical protein EQG64_20050 [Streptomyces sp. S6]
MRMRAKIITTVAAGMLAAAGMVTPATAATAPAERQAPVAASDVIAANTWVYTWTRANVRGCASNQCALKYTVEADYRFSAICWDNGQHVTAYGISHNKWVKLGSGTNWVWGGLLKGNQTGNVPNKC